MKAYDLRALRGDVTQEELRKEMGDGRRSWQVGTLTDIENGFVGIDQETYADLLAGIDRVKSRRVEREGVIA